VSIAFEARATLAIATHGRAQPARQGRGQRAEQVGETCDRGVGVVDAGRARAQSDLDQEVHEVFWVPRGSATRSTHRGLAHRVFEVADLAIPALRERIARATRSQYDEIATIDDLEQIFVRLPSSDEQSTFLPGLAHASVLGIRRHRGWNCLFALLEAEVRYTRRGYFSSSVTDGLQC